MANTDGPHGFIPVRHISGGCASTFRVALAAGNGSIGVGDLLVIDSTGTITGRSAASPAAGTVWGVAAEPKAASAGGTILTYPGNSTVFEGQTDNGTGTATAQTCVGNNINIVDTAPSNGISQQELDETSATTTNTLAFKIVGLYPVVGNAFGEFNRLEVMLNKHVLGGLGDGATGI